MKKIFEIIKEDRICISYRKNNKEDIINLLNILKENGFINNIEDRESEFKDYAAIVINKCGIIERFSSDIMFIDCEIISIVELKKAIMS